MPMSAASGDVGAAGRLGQRPDVVDADVAGPGLQRHDEGQLLGPDLLGEQADLGITEHRGRQQPVGQDGCAGHRRGRQRTARRGSRSTDGEADQRAQRHLLGPQPEQTGQRPERGAHRDRSGASEPAGGPADRRRERGTGRDALPQRRDLTRPLPGPGHGFRRRERSGAGKSTDDDRPSPPVRGQARARHAADDPGEGHRSLPAGRRSAVGRHPANLATGRERPAR